MDQLTCPQPDQVAQYVLGTLDEGEAQQVAAHLAECRQCQAVADQYDSAGDPLVDMLRSPKPQSAYEAEPQCRRALDRINDIRRKFPWILQSGEGEGSGGEGDDPAGGSQAPAGSGIDLPHVLGEYLLFEYIGGNLGHVYKALHLELERLVALKMLPHDLVADEAAAQRFAREIRATGRLDHPNLVRAHDAREIGGRRFLVMEYVDGCDLDALVRCRAPLPIADVCELARQAAVALQYVCQHGMVHRDIKPANLMLARDGQVKLLDLGLARFRISQQPSSTLRQPPSGDSTGPGVAMGTADYMAPEQASDSHGVDIRADIYSLGCTLYKLLAGRAPFEGPEYETVWDKLGAHLRQVPTPVRQLRSEVPAELAAVLDRMMAKNPAERFDTPDQVAAALAPFTEGCDLRALVTGRVTSDGSDEPARRPVPPRPRWRWEMAGLAGAAALVLMLLWARGVRDVARLDPPEPTQPRVEAPGATEPEIDAPESPLPPPVEPGVEVPLPPPSPAPDVDDTAPDPRPAEPGFAVRAELNHPNGVYRGPPAGPDGRGETIHVSVDSEEAGYLYLFVRQADGSLVCLFPNRFQSDNRVEAGRPVTVPDPDAALALRTDPPHGTRSGAPPSAADPQPAPEGAFTLRAGPPYGTETLLALVSREQLPPSRFGVASLTDRQFTLVDGEAVERLRGELQAGAGGSEVELTLTTRPADGQSSDPPGTAPPQSEIRNPKSKMDVPPAPDPDAATEAPAPSQSEIRNRESKIDDPDSERENPEPKIQNPKSTGPVLVAGNRNRLSSQSPPPWWGP